MNWTHLGRTPKGLVAAFAIVTISAAAPPAFASKTALGSPPEPPLLAQAIGGRCVPAAAKDILRSFTLQIANAPTVEEARALILSQTRLARTALATASWLLPFSASVQEARDKIENLESRVYAANTQGEVASDFAELLAVPTDPAHSQIAEPSAPESSPMMLAAENLNQPAASVSAGGGRCDYTTGEIIIICLGFLLFIIPGIIFLIVFC
jgi:hypothetical protein